MNEVSKRIADLSPEKRELLIRRLSQKRAAAAQTPISRQKRESNSALLSFAQQRLWFLDQLEPGSPVYNIPTAVRLTGALDMAALEQSLNEIVRRHEILRTTFAVIDGQPIQVIAPTLTLTLPVVDLRDRPAAEREAEAQRRATTEAQRPFNLAQGPLLRATALRLDEQEHVLLLTMHHIISDGWSMGIFIQEVATCYEAFRAGAPSPLPELPIQYADFALWQRQWLSGPRLQDQLAYWKRQLAGPWPVLELPSDRPRPNLQSFRGAAQPLVLSPRLSRALKALGRQEGATLFMVLLAAFQAWLHRYSGQTDLLVGTPIANRQRVETEGLIGFFVNTLVLRTDLTGDPSFRELVRRVREVALGAYAHQDLPFEQLVEALQPERALSHTPLFQAMFILQNAPLPSLAPSDLTLSPFGMTSGTAMFDLTLAMIDTEDELAGSLEYSTDLFDWTTINRMIGHFQVLLEGMASHPDQRLSQLPLLTEAERRQLLVEWNDTPMEHPQNSGVHQLFEAQAQRTPEAPAVIYGSERLTYGELNRRANQLAHRLRALGVGPEVLVAICVERSLEMIVGILGILKAGGAYVPLDPAYPKERLAFMLADTQAPILLTQARWLDNFPQHGARGLCLDTDWTSIAQEKGENPVSETASENLAYVIYTSGSTGQPKGVSITQGALANFVANGYAEFALNSKDRVLQFASLSFDVSAEEIFLSLTRGATLVLRTEAMLDSAPAFLQACRAENITVLDLPTAYWHELTAYWPASSDALGESLRLVIIGGERARPESLTVWQRHVGERVQLVNSYGPTEATIVATLCPLPGSAPAEGTRGEVPIGRPIRNVQVYVLDRNLQPVPIGVPGELHIGGVGLARGYLHRPELTAERFIPDPFSRQPGARLYKTGDRVRYRADGHLEFLGRTDHQVKLRGFRVELEEIEQVLAGHPDLAAAAVLARGNEAGDRHLIAYIVCKLGHAIDITELRNFLKERLPTYMVPSAFVRWDKLPLTPGGKVDRQALAMSDPGKPELGDAFVAPRTSVEKRLADIWARILKIERVGIHDNFFDLGGHSLLATQVIARLREAFQVEWPLRQLFESPTVAGMAEHIERALADKATGQALPIPRAPRDEDLPLSFAQQRLWFIDQLLPGSPAYNIPAAVRLKGPLHVAALERSLSEVLRRHEALRTTFPVVNGRPIQSIAPAQPLRLAPVDLRRWPEVERENEARRLAAEEARRPFDLAQGPLLRVTLLCLGDEDHILLLTMHHIISDGWSMDVLIREGAALYKVFSAGEPSPLPEMPIQYADFAHWQRQWLQGDVLETQLAYWKNQLTGAPMLQLLTDRPRPAVQTFRGARRFLELSEPVTVALKALSRQEGVTLFMTLLAALQTLLYRYTNQEDITVGAPIANRTRLETEELIGFFVNTLALRTDLSGHPRFRELLARVREVVLGAHAYQDLPFEKLVEELQPARDLSYQPLFQVVFVLQNTPGEALELPGLRWASLPVESGTAKFDLTLQMGDTGRQLIGALEYSTDLFDESTITRMLEHFQNLLEGIAEDPSQRLSELPLLSEAERQQLLVGWNNIQARYPQNQSLHQWFESQVERSPDAVAVTCGEERLHYRELNARANQLAHYLRRSGVGPEVLVGLCMERSLTMVVAILGILKAGGAYVPLDPAYPKERLSLLLEDSRMPVLVTERAVSSRLPDHGAQVVCLDSAGTTISQESTENPAHRTMPDNPAYVIYTSGSTGRPKGVPIGHANVVRLFAATDAWFHFNARDVWTLFHSYAFDFSVWELWGALLYGGRVVVVPYEVSRSPEAFYHLLHAEQVTVLNQTPSAFRQLIRAEESLGVAEDLALRWMIFGGEALDLPSLKPWFDRHGDARPQLVNMYGITETTVHVTYRPLRAADVSQASGSRIGGPIPDLQVYLLDPHMQPVPIGVPGEMYVGGAGLARGYLHRAELTAERFVPHPFSPAPGARLYRTGDRARYQLNGDIEYLGRVDHQVKIRGFRIEPGEIEAVLGQCPGVREVIVAARPDERGDKRLIAYVVAHPESSPTVGALRRFLRERLPEYMVPAAFVLLEKLPLTAHGKIDRQALPAPDSSRPHLESPFAAPRTPVEEILAGIWSEILGLEQVGIDDNFFALGGDSIRSIQIRAKALESGLDFSLQQLFQHQTIRALAQELQPVEDPTAARRPSRAFSLLSSEDRLRAPDDVEDAYPLTKIQGGMIFHSEYSLDYMIYITSVHLRAPLDVDKLQAVVQYLVGRHVMLRTSFNLTGFSEPMQLVHRTAHIPIQVEDLRSLSPAQQEEWLTAWQEAEVVRKFDWTRCPLLRFHVHRRSEDSFQFTLSEPIFDGWSVASLLTELFSRYFALVQGETPPDEPPLVASVRDFVALEWEALASEACHRYWARQLADRPASRLPRYALPDATAHTLQVLHVDVPIPGEISEGLKQLARSAAVPLKSVLLAAHLRVVSWLSGQSDVLTGVLFNGRPETTDGERILGGFLNALPFRLSLRGGTWTDLVRETFAAEREMLPFRRYPMAELKRQHGGPSLFDTLFNFTHFHVYQQLEGLAGTEVLSYTGSEQTYFALTAQFNVDHSAASRVTLGLDYRVSELSRRQVEAMAGYYSRALAAMTRAPFERYESVNLLSEAERYQWLVQWNDTRGPYAEGSCVHQLFEAQVERAPDAVAMVFEGESWTYGELNRRANQLARRLRALGVEPETLVGLCMERSTEMLVAVLGILKAGGAYVPIDPSYPKERIAFILADAQIAVLVTQPQWLDRVPEHKAQVLCLGPGWEVVAQERAENLINQTRVENLAYVIYTSGSTGRPKGVLITHRGVCNVIQASIETFALEAQSRVAQLASLSFDASVLEIFTALLAGARLVIVKRETVASSEELAARLRREAISHIMLLPSLLDALPHGEYPSLRTITVGGESCSAETVARWCWGRRLFNAYAPTEATIYATAMECRGDSQQAPPIGRPIANMRIYILDEHLQPVPPGVAGELHIGGVGLARGYLHRPELTAQQFTPDPFGGEAGARLYKTGDMARYRDDGNIEFLGRNDYQVKIRGFRIELGEIEAILAQHPDVRENVVIAREDTPGEKRLVAYVVTPPERTPTLGELRGFLRERLPDYMVPAVFMRLDALPLTPHGKLDRQALPTPDTVRPELETAFVAPRTPVEEVVAGIWAQVFRIKRVGIHDNFFELGGHSLLATQLISRLREAFHVELPLRRLFEAPTVAGLAESLEATMRAEPDAQAPPLQPAARDGDAPPSFAQQRLWFLDQLEPGQAFYNIPLAVRLQGHLNVEALERSLNEVVRRHETLRTTFVMVERELKQVIAAATAQALPLEDLQGIAEAERAALVLKQAAAAASQPFDLARGPLLRARLLRLAKDEHVLLLTMHHIISDGWSMGVLIRELATLCEAFTLGKPSPLPELPIQYADFAVWQRRWLQGEVLETQLSYWKQQLAGAPPMLDLATDRPRPPVQTFRGDRRAFELSQSLTEGIMRVSRQEEATLFMTLLTAFQTLLYRYTGQEDILVGSPIANRRQTVLEEMIGFFVNTLVLRADLSGDPSFRELLRRVREMALGAYAHQDLPFEQLVEALQPERNLSRHPLFQVTFVLQNMAMDAIELPGLTLSLLEPDTRTAKFDMTLLMSEGPAGLMGTLEYNTDLFDAGTITRMLRHFQTLLEAVVANPDERIAALPMLAEAERRQLLVEWNDTATGYPKDICIHALFEAQVKRDPNAVAVMFEEAQLTYGELNRRANQLAHILQARGVGPEVRVGIGVERSLEMLVAILGVLKAGGAYVPLDPKYPRERLAFMLEDAQVALLLTQECLLDVWPKHGRPVICLDGDRETLRRESDSNPAGAVTADHLAYVIYTSGSTGQPKGVMITHRNLVHSMQTRINYYNEPVDRFLLLSSFAFDSSVAGIFWTMCQGGTLVLPPEGLQQDVPRLADLIAQKKVSHMLSLPALYALLLEQNKTTSQTSLRCVIVAGEACPRELVSRHQERLAPVQLFNEYGPTEGTVWSTVYHCQYPAPETIVPIGRPIANTQIYILDAQQRPVPVGVAGEIYIGGEGLGRGYHHHPDLTAEKFIPNPFRAEPGARLYKTGDRARYRADGHIEFLGRADHQIKLRGFRIELEEIEAVLSQQPDVREAVVVARGEAPLDQRLVAYIVAGAEPAPSVSELRRRLQEKLPEYMVPATFVMMESLPRTPNGKINRRALPEPGQTRPELEAALVAPRTPVEEILAEIWTQVLAVEQVGVFDNFFELGGHSLLATQLISRVREAFQVELPLRRLFETPTVAGLAEALRQDPGERVKVERIAELMQRLAQMSDEEVEIMLNEKTSLSKEGSAS